MKLKNQILLVAVVMFIIATICFIIFLFKGDMYAMGISHLFMWVGWIIPQLKE